MTAARVLCCTPMDISLAANDHEVSHETPNTVHIKQGLHPSNAHSKQWAVTRPPEVGQESEMTVCRLRSMQLQSDDPDPSLWMKNLS